MWRMRAYDLESSLVHCSAEARAMYGLPPGEAPLTTEQW
ncbi:protein of unknown function [Rhodovastum atsumiense]|nr:protein of unknown function [Rhodovastum atsumiense]